MEIMTAIIVLGALLFVTILAAFVCLYKLAKRNQSHMKTTKK